MIVCIDFDGTCVTHDYPYIGKDIGAVTVLKKLIQNRHQLILFTMRSGRELNQAIRWFKDREIPLYGVNTNPTQNTWTSSPKAYGQMYIDDSSLGCPLRENKCISDKSFVNWDIVEEMLKKKEMI